MCHVSFSSSLLHVIRTGWKLSVLTVTRIILSGLMLFVSLSSCHKQRFYRTGYCSYNWLVSWIYQSILRLDSRQIKNTKLSFVMSCHSHGQFPPRPHIIVLYDMYITAFNPSTPMSNCHNFSPLFIKWSYNVLFYTSGLLISFFFVWVLQ